MPCRRAGFLVRLGQAACLSVSPLGVICHCLGDKRTGRCLALFLSVTETHLLESVCRADIKTVGYTNSEKSGRVLEKRTKAGGEISWVKFIIVFSHTSSRIKAGEVFSVSTSWSQT